MKKIIKIMLLFLILLPIVANAKMVTFSSTHNEITSYINQYELASRNKYLLTSNVMYDYDGKLISNPNFTNGGLLSKYEFEISKVGGKSYLAPGIEYWTITSTEIESYYIDNSLKSKSKEKTSGVRVTQFVKKETKVKGEGTYSNPWEFIKTNVIKIKTKNVEQGYVGKNDSDNLEIITEYLSSDITSYNFKVLPRTGYDYSAIEGCSLSHIPDNNYRLNNITNDIVCTIEFKNKIFKYTLLGEYTTPPSINELYLKYKSGWYSNSSATTSINKITPPTKTGYSFVGYYTEENGGGTIVIDQEGNIITETYDFIKNNDDEQFLYAYYIPTEYTISYTSDGCLDNTIDSESYTIETPTFVLSPLVTNTIGKTFIGWTGSNGSTPQVSITISKGSTGNKNYVANCRANIAYVQYTLQDGETLTTQLQDSEYKSENKLIYIKNEDSNHEWKKYRSTIEHNGLVRQNDGLGNYCGANGTMDIQKTGYSDPSMQTCKGAVTGSEWECNCSEDHPCVSDDGSVVTTQCGVAGHIHNYYSMTDDTYHSYDFCDTDNGDCTIEVKVNWKDDSLLPKSSMTSTANLKKTSQTLTLSCESTEPIKEYYFGTSEPTSSSTYTSVSGSTTYTTTKTISSSGTYYLSCKDKSGNISNVSSKTYYTYTLKHMLVNAESKYALDKYNTDNYSQTTSKTYLAPKGTTIKWSSVYTIPTRSQKGRFKGYSVGTAGTSNATIQTGSTTLEGNKTYSLWFWRNWVYIQYRVMGDEKWKVGTNPVYTWTKDANGYIIRDGDAHGRVIMRRYGDNTIDLHNVSSNEWSITLDGHTPVKNSEYKCYNGCKSNTTTFSQNKITVDFPNTCRADITSEDCTLTLRVNWN